MLQDFATLGVQVCHPGYDAIRVFVPRESCAETAADDGHSDFLAAVGRIRASRLRQQVSGKDCRADSRSNSKEIAPRWFSPMRILLFDLGNIAHESSPFQIGKGVSRGRVIFALQMLLSGVAVQYPGRDLEGFRQVQPIVDYNRGTFREHERLRRQFALLRSLG
jgi:hypothetical protein